ncbi:hypothetical protein Bca4012_027745 [Brassica carinata]|uniref:Uncharacterized protein n=1 Tax=Brassica carinata TaxID=52824 RepID=A0A8X8AW00_BRACI|nr:hypothetical protein Bca52824_024734 [Brassica carinata]
MHIAGDYLHDESRNQWGQNIVLMYDRTLRHPDRVRNMYFTILRKVSNWYIDIIYRVLPPKDLKTQSLIKQLLYSPKLQTACPVPFDEAKLWQGQSGPEFQKQFRNIRFPSYISESVKMVDMGPDVERLMEDQINKVSAKPSRLTRLRI